MLKGRPEFRDRPGGSKRDRLHRACTVIVLWAWLLLSVQPAFAQGHTGASGIPLLRQKLARHLKHVCLRKAEVGIRAFSLKSRRTLYDLKGHRLLIPASNAKIFTTAAAFHYLKPDYKFETKVFYSGRFSGGRLSGNLFLKGLGDPSLVSEELWILVRALKRRGLREVEGDLIVDDSYFDLERFVPGTNGGKGLRAYQAPDGAASLNFNTFGLYVEPNPVAGKPPRAVVDPDSSYIQLVNRAKTAKRRQKSTLRVRRATHSDGDLFILEGQIPAGGQPRNLWVNITSPALYLGHTFRQFLKTQGITIRGEVRRGKTPPQSQNLARHHSKPLSIILWDLNKWSNNFIAEQILKTIGAEVMGAPGTRQKGIAAIERYMTRLGYRPGTFKLADGAGLSRKNRASPAQLVRVLVDMHDDFRVRPEFVASLAVMGVDGSVKDRLDGTSAVRRIRAKTGTLDRVDTLSGYADSKDGDTIAFSILMNGSRCSHWKMRQIQDRLVLELVRLNRGKFILPKPKGGKKR
jgi:D-alanyl-D-alanine carboxypeptidase/D-alanyl-D-alanine-endopeptidase (penicillin-binding protein 4)